jgi:small subunit ribosomal protein S4
MHGRALRKRQTEYGRQLREKQKVKRMYGLTERQFRRFFRMAQKTRELTGLALLKLLERRLDNVVYRLGFARTRPQARQLVTHGHILVNGQRVNIPSYIVEPGQEITLREQARQIPDIQAWQESQPYTPGWLAPQDGRGQVLREPGRDEIDQDINEQLIIEFYSR